MVGDKPTYKELEVRLAEAEAFIDALRKEEADAVIGDKNVLLLRLKEMEDALKEARDKLEIRVQERTAELEAAYRQRDYLSHRLSDLVEKDRREIGKALHEEIGQLMTGVMLQMEKVKLDYRKEDFDLVARINSLQESLRTAVKQARKISRKLRPDVLDRKGLVPAIEELAGETEREAGKRVRLFVKNVPEDLGDEQRDLVIYRVVQESLTNILKHARANEISLNLIARNSALSLTIEDDGVGFDYDEVSGDKEEKEGTLGLTIMRERVVQVGGSFYVESNPGSGTQILVEIPLHRTSLPPVS